MNNVQIFRHSIRESIGNYNYLYNINFGAFMQLIVQNLARRNSHNQNIGEKKKRCPRFRSKTFDPLCHLSDITNMRDNIFLRNFHITSLLFESYTFA